METLPWWIPAIASVFLAITPVIIWVKILFGKTKDPSGRRALIWIFIGGSLSVVPIFLLQMLWDRFPSFDPFSYIEDYFINENNVFLFTFVLVGIMEEVVKHIVVRYSDKRHPEQFQTINDALRVSIVSALGFAFAENIFYFTNIWLNLTITDLISAFIFRSIFTMAGHMIFSGIFGYHFGIAKFAADITEHEKWKGKKFPVTSFFAKLFGSTTKTYEVYRERKIFEGLLWAMGIHAVFNFLLQLGMILPAILVIIVSGLFMYYLLQRKTGNLLFSFATRRASTMDLKDENVVIELLGMWSNEGKYKEIADICERLLARDPDNNVVKLFRAKAKDNQKLRGFYEALKEMFSEEKLAEVKGGGLPEMDVAGEQVVKEVMEMWFKQENYSQVIEVANRLLKKNPNSKGAQIIREKAYGKEKMKQVFDSLSLIFSSDKETE